MSHIPRTALIDGDIIAYRAAAWAHGNQGDLYDMAQHINDAVDEWTSEAFCRKAIICLSCPREENFRKDHYPLYKSHRTGEPPAMLGAAKDHIRSKAQTVTIPRLEADDIMGILATGTKVVNPVMVTIDKDLRTVPGWHFNPDKDDFPTQVTELQADHLFHMQWLTGDSTDGYGGIKGVGPAKARKILNAAPTDWSDIHEGDTGGEMYGGTAWSWATIASYLDKGYSIEECIAQARCARILRATDFDAETRTPKAWLPASYKIFMEALEVADGQ